MVSTFCGEEGDWHDEEEETADDESMIWIDMSRIGLKSSPSLFSRDDFTDINTSSLEEEEELDEWAGLDELDEWARFCFRFFISDGWLVACIVINSMVASWRARAISAAAVGSGASRIAVLKQAKTSSHKLNFENPGIGGASRGTTLPLPLHRWRRIFTNSLWMSSIDPPLANKAQQTWAKKRQTTCRNTDALCSSGTWATNWGRSNTDCGLEAQRKASLNEMLFSVS